MIVNKNNKGYQTRSDMPNANWLNEEEWYVVEDGTELAEKIEKLYPRFDFVVEDGKLVDVVEIPKTQEELNAEKETEIKQELAELDITINRATEDLYNLTNTTPYESTQNVINRKIELRNELKTLTGGGTVAEVNTNK